MYDSQVGKVQGYESSYQLKCKILKYTETQQVLRKIGKEEMYVPYTTTTAILVPDYSTTEFTKFMMAHNVKQSCDCGFNSVCCFDCISYFKTCKSSLHDENS